MRTIRAVDLFCGAGGSSSGLAEACSELGLMLDLTAINHWQIAVDTHTANHPGVRHLCESLDNLDPVKVWGARKRLDILWASPECTHHSVARGGAPINDQSRASAWHVTRWAERLRPKFIFVENVPEFQGWGPLGVNGKVIKRLRGATYHAWTDSLRSLGYRVEARVLNAADFGAATTRRRLYVQATLTGSPLWPAPTHAPATAGELFGKVPRWRPAREVIDWSLESRSIFGRKKPLSPRTLRRIEEGLRRQGPAAEPFIVILRQHQSTSSIDEPLKTMTTSGANFALAQPQAFILPANGERRGQDLRINSVGDPLATITTENRFALIESFAVTINHGTDGSGPGGGHARRAHDLDAPLPTLACSPAIAVIEPFIVGQMSGSAPRSVDRPIPTLTTTSRGVGLVEPFVVSRNNAEEGERAPRAIGEPLPTATARGAGYLVEPMVLSAGGPEVDARCVSQPMPTVLTRDRLAVVEPFVIHSTHAGSRTEAAIADPLPTITGAHRGEQALVEAFVVGIDQGSGNGSPRRVDEPLPTQTTKARSCLVEPYLTKYYGTGEGVAPVSEPVPTVTTRDRFGLVEQAGLDIHFRMLQPHELAAAMGFAPGYKFTGNKGDAVKQIGNAVVPNVAKALAMAVLA